MTPEKKPGLCKQRRGMFHGWITAGSHFIPFLFLSFPIHPLPYPLSATLQNHPFPAKVGGVRVGSPVSPPLFPFAICNFTGNSSSDTDDGVRRKRCWRRGIMYLCRGGPKACSFTLLQLAPLFPFPLPLRHRHKRRTAALSPWHLLPRDKQRPPQANISPRVISLPVKMTRSMCRPPRTHLPQAASRRAFPYMLPTPFFPASLASRPIAVTLDHTCEQFMLHLCGSRRHLPRTSNL